MLRKLPFQIRTEYTLKSPKPQSLAVNNTTSVRESEIINPVTFHISTGKGYDRNRLLNVHIRENSVHTLSISTGRYGLLIHQQVCVLFDHSQTIRHTRGQNAFIVIPLE